MDINLFLYITLTLLPALVVGSIWLNTVDYNNDPNTKREPQEWYSVFKPILTMETNNRQANSLKGRIKALIADAKYNELSQIESMFIEYLSTNDTNKLEQAITINSSSIQTHYKSRLPKGRC